MNEYHKGMNEKQFKLLLQKQKMKNSEKAILSEFEKKMMQKNRLYILKGSLEKTQLGDTIYNGIKRKVTHSQIRYFNHYSMGIVASFLFLVSAFFYIKSILNPEARILTVTVKQGEQKKILLPDSSIVVLNSQSIFSYPEYFSDSLRQVNLKGEAFFSIKKNKSKAFLVSVDNIKIEVLGTSFNVESYNEQEQARITLNKGKLKITNSFNESVFLVPLEQAIWDKNRNTLKKIKISHRKYSGWKDGILFFDAISLSEVAKKIERWYNVEVYIEKSILSNKTKFTGSFKDATLKTVLENMVFIDAHISYKLLSDKKILFQKKEQ